MNSDSNMRYYWWGSSMHYKTNNYLLFSLIKIWIVFPVQLNSSLSTPISLLPLSTPALIKKKKKANCSSKSTPYSLKTRLLRKIGKTCKELYESYYLGIRSQKTVSSRRERKLIIGEVSSSSQRQIN